MPKPEYCGGSDTNWSCGVLVPQDTKSYYFDASGHFWADWFNDCTNAQRPCKDIDRLSKMTLKGGDVFSFAGGTVYDLSPPGVGPSALSRDGLATFLILAAVILLVATFWAFRKHGNGVRTGGGS